MIDMPIAVVACGSYILPPITGTNLSGNEAYYTQPNQTGVTYNAGDEITMNTVLYIYDIISGCSNEVFFTITISAGPVINMPDTISNCNSVILPPIDGVDLSANVAYFENPGGMGTEYQPGEVFNQNTTLYIFDGDMDCFAEKIIEIEIEAGPFLDQPNDTMSCDFFVLQEITGTDLVNPFYTDEDGILLLPGDTIFADMLPCMLGDSSLNGGCFVSRTFNINIVEQPVAGSDIPFNDCGGSVFDLSTILDAGADSGMFVDSSTTGALNGSDLDLNLINDTFFNVFYVTENMCGIDSANYTVTISGNADAGNNTSSSVCAGEDLSLSDFVNQADSGGIFENTVDGSIVTDFNSDEIVTAGGSLLFYYIVGSSGTCDPDTAEINFVVVTSPTLNLPDDQTSCSGYELPDIDGTDLSGTESYNTMIDGSGTIYQPGDTLENSATLYVQSGVGNCAAVDSFDVTVLESQPTLIQETICNDDTLTVNGIKYWFENDFGVQNFTTAEGCDSTVEVQLTFFETDTNFVNEQICWGGTFIFYGVTLDRDKPSTQVVIPLADKNNCDSVIFVNITFDDPITRNINQSLCENDSILINGVYYSMDNPSGIDTVEVFEQCDTILNINITFDEAILATVDDELCEGDEIVVGGEVFNESNPQGEVTVPGTISCDSVITVDLTFVSVPMGMLTGEFCSNEVIDTLGEIFSVNNPEMEIVLEGASAQNCDSTVFVSFDFILVEEGSYVEEVCEGSTVMVLGTEFNESNPTGQVMTLTTDGCDSIINVAITFNSVDADFLVFDGDCDSETGYFVFQAFSEMSSEYFYSLDNSAPELIEIGDTLFDIAAGDHEITFSITEGCETSVEFEITESTNVTLDLQDVVAINEGDTYSVNLQGLDNATISWLPPTDISCFDCPDPIFSPSSTTTYTVTVIDEAGCTAMDTIVIRVEETFNVYIPNSFSPNEDGINDRFLIFSETDIEYDLSIYDRWGNRVFEELDLITNDTNSGWDGRSRSRAVSQGVYVFVAVLDKGDDSEPEIRKGTITVVR